MSSGKCPGYLCRHTTLSNDGLLRSWRPQADPTRESPSSDRRLPSQASFSVYRPALGWLREPPRSASSVWFRDRVLLPFVRWLVVALGQPAFLCLLHVDSLPGPPAFDR